MKASFTLFFFFLAPLLFSQRQANVWCFGSNAGIDFNSGSAVPFTGSQLNALECSSSICDNNGSLLFYTDGNKAWSNNHTVMPNGSNLLGGTSSTQTLIVPAPGTCSLYYIFQVEDHLSSQNRFSYSVVDMCLNGGLGDVIASQKNIVLAQSCGEKMTAVLHQNGTDVWVITHSLGNNHFSSYLVTALGVQPAVVSAVGGVHGSTQMIGPAKASHNGTKICVANTFGSSLCELFDFNRSTGILSNPMNLQSTYGFSRVYGIEFSPNDNLLYLATTFNNNNLYQINLSTSTITTISIGPSGGYFYGALSLAYDGKIYMARNQQNFLACINAPDLPGTACNFVNNALPLSAGTNSEMGLPNFAPYLQMPGYTSNFINLGADTTILNCNSTLVLSAPGICNSNYTWSTGSTASSITVNTSGTYSVSVSNICGTGWDSIQVTFAASPASVQASVTTICAGDSITLVGQGGSTGYWLSPLDSLNDTVVVAPVADSDYSYVTSSVCGNDTATVHITIGASAPPPASIQASATTVCAGDSLTLVGQGAAAGYWLVPLTTSNDTVVVAPVTDADYSYVSTNVCGSDTATIHITALTNLQPSIQSSATLICAGDSVVLVVQSTSAGNWLPPIVSSNDTVIVMPVADADYFFVSSNVCGTDTADVHIAVHALTDLQASVQYSDTIICAGDSVVLIAQSASTGIWQAPIITSGDTILVFPVVDADYSYVTSNACGTDTADIHITIGASSSPQVSVQFSANPVCEGDSVVLVAQGTSVGNWLSPLVSNDDTVIVMPVVNTAYSYVSSNVCGTDTASVQVIVNTNSDLQASIQSSATVICAGTSVVLVSQSASYGEWQAPLVSLNDTVTVAPTIDSDYSYVTSNACGTDTAVVHITIGANGPPQASIMASVDTVCAGGPVTLIAQGTLSGSWQAPVLSSNDTVVVTPVADTDYAYVATNVCGTDTADVHIAVNTIGDLQTSIQASATVICAGSNVTLIAQSASAGSWQVPLVSSNNIIVVAPPTDTDYSYVTSNACGTDTATIHITIEETLPDATFQVSQVPCTGSVSVTGIAFGNANSSWSFGDGTTAATNSVEHTYATSGTYIIQHLLSTPGCSDTSSHIITVKIPENNQIDIPNIFTPNDDGLNDRFIVVQPDHCFALKGEIYDRWGMKLFESADLTTQGWDGIFKGNPVPDGVYFVLVFRDNELYYNGTIQLIGKAH